MRKRITRLMLTASIAAGMTLGAVPAIAETANDETIEADSESEEEKTAESGGCAAMIGEAGYDSLEEAIDAAEEGDIVLLKDDCVADHTIVIDKDIDLDLNGFTICNTEPILDKEADAWSLISVQGAKVTIGGGAVNALEDDCYTFDVRDGGLLALNDGTYVGNTSVVYVFDGILVVNDGYFSLIQESEEYGTALMFNCSDEAYEDGGAVIVVYGGTFDGWDLIDGRGVCLAAEEAEIDVDENGNYVVTTPRDDAGGEDPDADESGDDTDDGTDEDALTGDDADDADETDEDGVNGDIVDDDADGVNGDIVDIDAEGTEDTDGAEDVNVAADAGSSDVAGNVNGDADGATDGSAGSSASMISSVKTGDPASLYALAALLSGGAGGTGIAFGRRRELRRR